MSNKNPGEVERRDSADLRAAVDEGLARAGQKIVPPGRPAGELLHSLHVHQIELEMQNENLRQTQVTLEESRDRFMDLYDFSPVAYLTLTDKGMISEINLTGARLLGVERKKLFDSRFSRFIAPEYIGQWHVHFMEALKNNGTHSCELVLQRGDGSVLLARMDCLHVETGKGAHSVRIVLTDFSERRRMATEIEQSRRALDDERLMLQSVLDNAPIGIWMLGVDNKLKFINKTFCNAVGIPESRFLTVNHYSELLPPPVSASCIKSDCECFEREGIHVSAEWLPFVDGKAHLLEITKVKLYDHERRTIGLIGLAADITERNRAETLLRESEEKLSVIFECTLDGILLADAQTRQFFSGNPAICQMLGYSHEELVRLGVSDIHPLPDLPHVIERFEALLRGKAKLAENIPVKRKDGSVFYADVTAVPVNIGDKVYLVGIFRDITERKQAEEIRRSSALKHQVLFESSRDALMTLAPPLWKFTGANEATLKLFGASGMDEFTALAPWEISPERQPDGRLSSLKAQEMIATAMREGSCSFEWEHRRLNGQPFSADVLLTRMALGNELFVLATVRDITERKRTENKLGEYHQLLRELAAQGAASREAESKRIAREVHDELGQLLTALRMDISLLRIEFGERDPLLMGKIQDMLVLVDKSIQGVRDVTANLRPASLDMGIVPAIAWLCDEFPDRTNTACTLRVVDEPVGLDDARTVALFRIVQESLTNVARHAGASSVEITVRKCEDDIAVEVRDNGKGFDSAARSAKKSFGLMGMRERAIALGGKVEIASTPSAGTVVSVRIPIFQTHPGRRIND